MHRCQYIFYLGNIYPLHIYEIKYRVTSLNLPNLLTLTSKTLALNPENLLMKYGLL